MPTEVDAGKTAFGGDWKVVTNENTLIVLVDGVALVVADAERDRFAEAVARAVTPGQAQQTCEGGC